MPDAKIGSMLARMQSYPKTPNPADVRQAQQDDELNLFFTDVQVRGEYPNYMNRYFNDHNITLEIVHVDLQLIKDYPVDYLSFSYYMSMVSSAKPAGEKTAGNLILGEKIRISKLAIRAGKLIPLVYGLPSTISGNAIVCHSSSSKTP